MLKLPGVVGLQEREFLGKISQVLVKKYSCYVDCLLSERYSFLAEYGDESNLLLHVV